MGCDCQSEIALNKAEMYIDYFNRLLTMMKTAFHEERVKD